MSASVTVAPIIVLDTNVVLDWLLFRDPGCSAIQAALTAGHVRWIATVAMRGELAHVLERQPWTRWDPDLPALWASWNQHCREVATPALTGPGARPRCTDPDDQKFVDLAAASGARWLMSRDRAVLKLARRLLPMGVEVLTPDNWAQRRGAAEAAPPA